MVGNQGRVAYLASAAAVLDVSDRLTDEVMQQPALGDWDVRGLAGHLLRGIRTPIDYLERDRPESPPIDGAAAYFARYLDDVEADPSVPAAVAARGSSVLEGFDAAGARIRFHETVELARSVIEKSSTDRIMPTAYDVMYLDDYLRARSFEIVVHGLDLARALRVEWHPPVVATLDATVLLAEVAVLRGVEGDMLLALTGRSGVTIPRVVG